MEKPWNQVTREEILENKKKYCNHCVYASRFNVGTKTLTLLTCDYSLEEKHSRGCSPINCAKFVPRAKRKRSRPITVNHKERSDTGGQSNFK